MEKKTNRTLILIAGFVINFSLSATSAFSIFVNPVIAATGWPQGRISLAFTLYSLLTCVFGIVVGSIGPRINARRLMIIGSLSFVTGWIVTGLSTSVFMFCLGFGILCGIGGGCLYNFSVTNTMKWFPDKKGMVSGLLLGGAAIGPVFCSPVATMLLNHMTVFNAFIVFGCIYAVLMFSVIWFVKVPEKIQTNTNVNVEGCDWKQMLRTPKFYVLYCIFVLACTPYLMMIGAAASIGQLQAGMTPAVASLAVSLLALSNFSGRMIFGALSDKFRRYRTLLCAVLICFVSVILMSRIKTQIPFLINMCVIGACGGALLVMFPPITSDCFGLKNSGMNYSIMFSGYSIGALVGPQLVSYFQRTRGEYTMAFVWSAVLMAIAAVLLFILDRKEA